MHHPEGWPCEKPRTTHRCRRGVVVLYKAATNEDQPKRNPSANDNPLRKSRTTTHQTKTRGRTPIPRTNHTPAEALPHKPHLGIQMKDPKCQPALAPPPQNGEVPSPTAPRYHTPLGQEAAKLLLCAAFEFFLLTIQAGAPEDDDPPQQQPAPSK
ncbi:hypothetical protein BS47DRAFT_1358114 [Hydnum rufescens UP504]|uniref:Uncharacterized protein n=1 Tax=Hydnum rufescens UP504 TaxID=1448309 RepID=A0A9P6B8K9_9AGAM|nr:hypothetical protein BS47DRAFT_1358114 [Hydnum rufescens UP504]